MGSLMGDIGSFLGVGNNGNAQDGEQHQRRRQEQSDSQDFIQQLRLGLIPADGDE